MFKALSHIFRLGRAARTLAAYDVLLQPDQIEDLPGVARVLLAAAKLGKSATDSEPQARINSALSALGPSYIKLGQFLATRPDLIGPTRAFELKALQDRLPPFDTNEALTTIRRNLGADASHAFHSITEPVAAASIAQVHRAVTSDGKSVAVKVLRPNIKKRFAADLESFYFAARVIERFSEEGRRLRPIAAVEVLERSMKLELDLRMEAAAISEMAENIGGDKGFRTPRVDWQRTDRDVLTTDWIDGTPISNVDALKARGFDLKALGDSVIQHFLRHAIRDGFFHADMHPGNLFVDHDGNIVAVDFGIMGRLGPNERMFLAEILYGFILRDYARVSRVHFEAGYVPRDQNMMEFAQALRAIGEPIMDRSAREISMARLLTQLFEVTGQFHMSTQPQLLLLQKTMVVVEGVARTLNPELNMWTAAEPVVRPWIERRLGPAGKLEDAISAGLVAVRQLPEFFNAASRAIDSMEAATRGGAFHLDRTSIESIARVQRRGDWLVRGSWVVCAVALLFIAWSLSA